MAKPSPPQKKNADKRYDRLLKGEITSKEYVQGLKERSKAARDPSHPKQRPSHSP